MKLSAIIERDLVILDNTENKKEKQDLHKKLSCGLKSYTKHNNLEYPEGFDDETYENNKFGYYCKVFADYDGSYSYFYEKMVHADYMEIVWLCWIPIIDKLKKLNL